MFRNCRLFGAWGTLFALGGLPARAEPVTVRGTQFFLDDFVIERMEGLTREFHAASKRGVVKGNEKPWETASGGNGVQVFKDGEHWHMYYSAVQWNVADNATGDVSQQYRCIVCCATSTDGLKWNYPVIGRIATPSSSEGGWNGRMRPVGSTRENN